MLQGQRVLVVDPAPDTADILRAVLEPRGVQVERVRNTLPRSGVGANPPTVLVIDGDQAPRADESEAAWPSVPQVILGTVHKTALGTGIESDRHYLAKPFQYAELVQTIERLAARRAA